MIRGGMVRSVVDNLGFAMNWKGNLGKIICQMRWRISVRGSACPSRPLKDAYQVHRVAAIGLVVYVLLNGATSKIEVEKQINKLMIES